MRWIYLSPHLDDVALSCGGLVWQQAQNGEDVEIWTICAGPPPAGVLSAYAQMHHDRWDVTAEEVLAVRRHEDAAACAVLGGSPRYFEVPDAIYRKHSKTGEPMYTNREDLFGGVHPGDEAILEQVVFNLAQAVPGNARLVAPLTVGNHVDHQLVRLAASRLQREVWYYPDYPYTVEFPEVMPSLAPEGYYSEVFPVCAEAMTAWEKSASQFRSQISTFWKSEAELARSLRQHAALMGGVCLWRL